MSETPEHPELEPTTITPEQQLAELDPELVASINELEPMVVIPANQEALAWLEGADAAMHVLGLKELHDELWGEVPHDGASIEQAAVLAEKMMIAVKEFLRDHGIPSLEFWAPSHYYGAFLQFRVHAAK